VEPGISSADMLELTQGLADGRSILAALGCSGLHHDFTPLPCERAGRLQHHTPVTALIAQHLTSRFASLTSVAGDEASRPASFCGSAGACGKGFGHRRCFTCQVWGPTGCVMYAVEFRGSEERSGGGSVQLRLLPSAHPSGSDWRYYAKVPCFLFNTPSSSCVRIQFDAACSLEDLDCYLTRMKRMSLMCWKQNHVK
jgi:hypothetical protein